MKKVYTVSKQDDRKLENLVANMRIEQLRVFLYGIARGWDFDKSCSIAEEMDEWKEIEQTPEIKEELTIKELGRVFELFQNIHSDSPNMRLEIDAFMAGTGIRPGIYYGVGRHNCYIASYSTGSVEELYELMKKDIGE
jgi:hypothetical protein